MTQIDYASKLVTNDKNSDAPPDVKKWCRMVPFFSKNTSILLSTDLVERSNLSSEVDNVIAEIAVRHNPSCDTTDETNSYTAFGTT